MDSFDYLIHHAIRKKVFPGAVVGITNPKKIIYQKAFGTTAYDFPESIPVEENFIYDCASLTKFFPTAGLLLKFSEEGKLDLKDKISRFFPQFKKEGKEEISISDFLANRIPLEIRLSEHKEKEPQDIIAAALSAPLAKTPPKAVSPNAPYLILGLLLEKVAGESLDQLARRYFLDPFGLSSTSFAKTLDLLRTVPAEVDVDFRKKMVWGEVHDESAWKIGKPAGFAGLFSNTPDLLKVLRAILSEEILSSPSIALLEGGVGSMTNLPFIFGKEAKDWYGKTGFTGTFVAIHRKRKLGVVLLSNAIFPKRPGSRRKINLVRSTLCDLICQMP